jgi:hypothetical protein
VIILTNLASQELAPGQSLTFNVEVLHTGRCECHRPNSGAVILRRQQAVFGIHFSANIGATEPGVAQLSICLNSSPLIETTMQSTTNAAGDLNNVSKYTAVQTCCGPETITVVNTGETTVTVEDPSLFVERKA